MLVVLAAALSVLVAVKWLGTQLPYATIDIRDPRVTGFYVSYEVPADDDDYGEGSAWGPNLLAPGIGSVTFAQPGPSNAGARFRVTLSDNRSCYGEPRNAPWLIDARFVDGCVAD